MDKNNVSMHYVNVHCVLQIIKSNKHLALAEMISSHFSIPENLNWALDLYHDLHIKIPINTLELSIMQLSDPLDIVY